MPPSQTLFPPISELPLIQNSEKWIWSRIRHEHDFWIGEDEEGHKWLVKMRGSFWALRERAFSSIAQNLGLSCQSSTFLKLSSDSEPLRRSPDEAPEQLAIWFVPEHAHGFCGQTCPLRWFSEAFDDANDKISALKQSPISNAIDWARGVILGYLCDMHEPPGRLFTPNHEFVQIDNELMFTDAHADLWECDWLRTSENEWSEAGVEEARHLCQAVAELPDAVIARATDTPPKYEIEMIWDIPRQAGRIRKKARVFLAEAKSGFGT